MRVSTKSVQYVRVYSSTFPVSGVGLAFLILHEAITKPLTGALALVVVGVYPSGIQQQSRTCGYIPISQARFILGYFASSYQ